MKALVLYKKVAKYVFTIYYSTRRNSTELPVTQRCK